MREVIELIKGKYAAEAQGILKLLNKKGARLLEKALNSAVSNAKNKGYREDKLFISGLAANPGPMLKRYRAASFGRATMIRKRMSHLVVELDTQEKTVKDIKVK